MNDLLLREWPVECRSCGKVFSINAQDFDFQEEGFNQEDERPMGVERVFETTLCDYRCPICKCKLEKITLYEYPDGGQNYAVAE